MRACVRVCACVRACVLRIVSMDKMVAEGTVAINARCLRFHSTSTDQSRVRLSRQ